MNAGGACELPADRETVSLRTVGGGDGVFGVGGVFFACVSLKARPLPLCFVRTHLPTLTFHPQFILFFQLEATGAAAMCEEMFDSAAA